MVNWAVPCPHSHPEITYLFLGLSEVIPFTRNLLGHLGQPHVLEVAAFQAFDVVEDVGRSGLLNKPLIFNRDIGLFPKVLEGQSRSIGLSDLERGM